MQIKKISNEEMQLCCIYNDKGRAVGVKDEAVCVFIKTDYHIFILSGIPFIYDAGKYIADVSGALTKTIIKNYIEFELIKSTTINRIYNLLIADYELQACEDMLNRYPDNWIPFDDCLYSVLDGVENEYKPEYRVINKIPYKYADVKQALNGEELEKFFEYALSKEDRQTILEFFGYCMTKNKGFQKFLLLKGSRGTGKSVLLSLLEKIVGRENVSNVPLQNLEEKFYSIQLLHKLVNVCCDLSALPLKSTNSIKLITGNDFITDSYKGKDLITFCPYAKLVFSCNAIPLILDGDSSNAFYQRIILVSMDNAPDKPDRELKSKLENEILYLINISIKAYKQALERGYIYESENTKRMVAELYSDSDSLQAFLDECTRAEKNDRVSKSQLYQEYLTFCDVEGREPLAKHSFNRKMRSKGFAEYKSGVDSWRGLTLIDWNNQNPFVKG